MGSLQFTVLTREIETESKQAVMQSLTQLSMGLEMGVSFLHVKKSKTLNSNLSLGSMSMKYNLCVFRWC